MSVVGSALQTFPDCGSRIQGRTRSHAGDHDRNSSSLSESPSSSPDIDIKGDNLVRQHTNSVLFVIFVYLVSMCYIVKSVQNLGSVPWFTPCKNQAHGKLFAFHSKINTPQYPGSRLASKPAHNVPHSGNDVFTVASERRIKFIHSEISNVECFRQ